MKNANYGFMWNGFCKWLHKSGDAQLARNNGKREQSIEILQKRYGYTKEKASSEFTKHYSKARLG